MWFEYKGFSLVNLDQVSRIYLDGERTIMMRFANGEFRKFEFDSEAEACEVYQIVRSKVFGAGGPTKATTFNFVEDMDEHY